MFSALVFLAATGTVATTLSVFSDSDGFRLRFVAGNWDITPAPVTNCTNTLGYWKTHVDMWPVDEITVADITYSKIEVVNILETPAEADVTIILAHQLIAAMLNIHKGADPSEVVTVLVEANEWLKDNPLGSEVSPLEQEEGQALAEILDLYNNGLIGPGLCLEEVEDESASLPVDTTLTQTPTLTQTLTLDPSATPDVNSDPSPAATKTPLPKSTKVPTKSFSATPTLALTELPPLTPTSAPTKEISPTATPTPDKISDSTPTSAPTEKPPSPGCTHSAEYWLRFPDDWPLDEFRLGERDYDQAEALDILNASPDGDATYLLARQYISVQLNIAGGAEVTEIEGIVEQADIWFMENPLGSNPDGPDRDIGLLLAEALADYNLGQVGPGLCEDEIPTPTPTPSSTPSPMPTPAPTSVPAPVDPTDTPTIEPTTTLTETPIVTPTPTGDPSTG